MLWPNAGTNIYFVKAKPKKGLLTPLFLPLLFCTMNYFVYPKEVVPIDFLCHFRPMDVPVLVLNSLYHANYNKNKSQRYKKLFPFPKFKPERERDKQINIIINKSPGPETSAIIPHPPGR